MLPSERVKEAVTHRRMVTPDLAGDLLLELDRALLTVATLGRALAATDEDRLPPRPELTDAMREQLRQQAIELRDRMVPRNVGPLMRSARLMRNPDRRAADEDAYVPLRSIAAYRVQTPPRIFDFPRGK